MLKRQRNHGRCQKQNFPTPVFASLGQSETTHEMPCPHLDRGVGTEKKSHRILKSGAKGLHFSDCASFFSETALFTIIKISSYTSKSVAMSWSLDRKSVV